MDIELLHQLAAVGFHSLDRQIKAPGNVLGAQAFRNELQHLALARRKLGGLWLAAAQAGHVVIQNTFRHCWTQVGFAAKHRLDGELKLHWRGIF